MLLPEKFVERVLRDLGEREGCALCDALEGESPVSVRLNPAKTGVVYSVTPNDTVNAADVVSPDTPCPSNVSGIGRPTMSDDTRRVGNPTMPGHISEEGFDSLKPEFADAEFSALEFDVAVPWCSDGRYLKLRPQFTLDPDFHAGAYYVQEASSQFVGRLLQGVETQGARVLDLCAAPGGKTTLYASLVGRDGLVVANEVDRRRAQVLVDNVRKWGLGNIAVTTCEPRFLGDWEGWFDVVAVDAPCSGEGMFRKDEQARAEWSENNVRQCAMRQDEILREAWRSLRPGGTLLYSTCTFNRDEDEGSLERMLAWAGDEVVEADEIMVDESWGVVRGRVGSFQTFRFYPHRTKGEGFFAAVARKTFDAGGRSRLPKARRAVFSATDRQTTAELARWVKRPEKMRFAVVADTCYGYAVAQYEAVKSLSETIPVIYSGVAMGQVFKGKLKPDSALAFYAGLNRDAVPAVELGEEEALRFLRKQDIAAVSLAEGMNLICSRGRGLGFAKRIGSRVNNMYPNSLRIMKL